MIYSTPYKQPIYEISQLLIPGADHGLGSPYYVNLIRYYFIENLLGQRLDNVDMSSID